MNIIFAIMAVASAKPIAEYTRLNLLEKTILAVELATAKPANDTYLFDTSGYFDHVEPTNGTLGFLYLEKGNSVMVYDAGIQAFRKNKNTYFQCAPPWIKYLVEEDKIGIKLSCDSAERRRAAATVTTTNFERDAEQLAKILKRMKCAADRKSVV